MAGKGEVERFGELVDVRFALGKPRQDRPPGGVGQRRESHVEPIIRGQCHPQPLTLPIE